jgi:hypothetical protein
MPLPLVRLVTPASASTDSVDAFGKELTKLKWLWAPPPPPQTLDFKVCSVEDTLPPNNTLAIQAQSAVTDVQNALQQTPNLKVVIVTAGIDATSAVLQILPANSTIPVVQAAGGWLPSPLPGNVTGFVLNPLDPFRPFGTSAKQLKKLVEKGGNNPLNIGVLYDANNGLSTLALNALQALAPKLSPAPGIVPINTNGDVHNFTVASCRTPLASPVLASCYCRMHSSMKLVDILLTLLWKVPVRRCSFRSIQSASIKRNITTNTTSLCMDTTFH